MSAGRAVSKRKAPRVLQSDGAHAQAPVAAADGSAEVVGYALPLENAKGDFDQQSDLAVDNDIDNAAVMLADIATSTHRW